MNPEDQHVDDPKLYVLAAVLTVAVGMCGSILSSIALNGEVLGISARENAWINLILVAAIFGMTAAATYLPSPRQNAKITQLSQKNDHLLDRIDAITTNAPDTRAVPRPIPFRVDGDQIKPARGVATGIEWPMPPPAPPSNNSAPVRPRTLS